jgi:putative transposase
MKRIIHPLRLLLARATEKGLVRYIEYLKTENRIMRSKLPRQISVTQAERAKLIQLGQRLGSAIKDLITIVPPGPSPVGSARPRRA